MSVMQDIYDSEINVRISTMWDGGYDVALGDEMNGFVAETTVYRWGEVEPWLTEQVIKHWPHSTFAMMYRDGLGWWQAHEKQRADAEAAALTL